MANSEGSDDMLNRVMPKDNIGLAALLKTKEAAWDNCKYILVAKLKLWNVCEWIRAPRIRKCMNYDCDTSATEVDLLIAEQKMERTGIVRHIVRGTSCWKFFTLDIW